MAEGWLWDVLRGTVVARERCEKYGNLQATFQDGTHRRKTAKLHPASGKAGDVCRAEAAAGRDRRGGSEESAGVPS